MTKIVKSDSDLSDSSDEEVVMTSRISSRLILITLIRFIFSPLLEWFDYISLELSQYFVILCIIK